jgi:small subunit ribosomal protein S16
MLKIRMQRIGRKNEAQFRIVLIDARKGPKSAKAKEILGSYNPRIGSVEVKAEQVKHWLGQGAQPSTTVFNFLVTKGIIEGRKKNALPKKTAPIKEVVAEVIPEPIIEKASEVVEEAVLETETKE